MTDKQLERGNAIKKELKGLETSLAVSYYTFGSVESIKEGHPLYEQSTKIAQSAEKRISQLFKDRIESLKKEFAKL